MGTFVLVHGAWSGAHGFRHVRRLLQREGHEVFTPSLTGLGERVHLTGPLVGLTTHVHDVVNHILYEDLDDIVLLGFSYGGFVVTGALAHIGERVRHLVYLDAFVPVDGLSLDDLTGGPMARIELGQEWLLGGSPREIDDEAEAAFMNARRVGQPLRCFTEPLRIPRPIEDYPFERTYIRASAETLDSPGSRLFHAAAEHARTSPAWHLHEIATNHLIPTNRPAELAAILAPLGR